MVLEILGLLWQPCYLWDAPCAAPLCQSPHDGSALELVSAAWDVTRRERGKKRRFWPYAQVEIDDVPESRETLLPDHLFPLQNLVGSKQRLSLKR